MLRLIPFSRLAASSNVVADLIYPVDNYLVLTWLQVLQTLSILIQNIRSETAIFYLFSNNYINELITTRLVNRTALISCACVLSASWCCMSCQNQGSCPPAGLQR